MVFESLSNPIDDRRDMIGAGEHPVLGGRYRIIEHLGDEESVEVYLARDGLLKREINLKVLREEYAADPDIVESFRVAARKVSSLTNPNVVQLYELSRSDSGLPFVAMEYVRGDTLEHGLRRSGALYPTAAAEFAVQISGALRDAHEQGLFHCDLNTRNVLIAESGEIKVAGFGFGRGSPEREGTGLDGADGVERDLYSLGAILYEMLTGVQPFPESGNFPRAGKDANGVPKAPAELDPRIPEWISDLTLRLISDSPEERPADASALIGELEKAGEASRYLHSGPETTGAYRAGIELLPGFVKRMRSLSTGLLGGDRDGRDTQRKSGLEKRLRRQRIRSLALIPLTLLVAASAWMLYESGLGTAPLGVSQQTSTSTQPGENVGARAVLVHTARPQNISSNSTYLDIPTANGDPEARISITQNWNPDGDGTYNDHPVGVWYDSGRERWAIFNQDRAAMPEGASFNVVVWSEGGGG